jgi:uncharacterized protein (TIGR03437 family)
MSPVRSVTYVSGRTSFVSGRTGCNHHLLNRGYTTGNRDEGTSRPNPMKLFFQIAALAAALIPIANAQIFGSNIIVNSGAESGAGGDGTSQVANVPGWSGTGGCDVYTYATAYSNVSAIKPTDIVPRGTGNNYFAGGIQPLSCTFTQGIDLSSGGPTFDAGTVTFAASAYLGGFGSDGDNATLGVVFEDGSGNQLSSLTLGPVGPSDRANQQSGLYLQRQIGQIPVGTRSAVLTLNMNWVNGANNEAFADNLALVLNAPAMPRSLLGVNLLVNPGADASPGYDQSSTTEVSTDLPGWVRSAYLTADSYQDTGGDLDQVSAVPPDAGSNYFYGGVNVTDDSNPIATAFQDIDVSSAASLIDAGNLAYTLAGWLGGYEGQDDHCVLSIQFQDWAGNMLGTDQIGPVLAADRNNTTELLQESTNGNVPSGTRVIQVLMTMTREEGTNNDGLADSLSLVLGSVGNGGPEITGTVITAGAYGAFDAVTPGTWMEIYGENLAAALGEWSGADFNGVNAPTSLDGTSVTIGGQAAFIYFINPTQIDALVPGTVSSGQQPVIVTTANGRSAPFLESVNPAEPGLLAPASFAVNGNQYVVALFSDGATYVLPPGAVPGVASRQAKPGETITAYGIGFGDVTPSISAGQIEEGANSLNSPFQLLFGSTPATLSYSGLAPSFVGLYQFNIVVPNVPNSDLVPIIFTLGAVSGAQTLYTAVHN